jgi:hypothetical protein
MVDGVLRWVKNDDYNAEYAVRPSVELDGKIGLAASDLAYDLAMKVGVEERFLSNSNLISDLCVYAGIADDAYGPIRHALTVPVDVAYRIDVGSNMLGVHGGPRFAIGDRDFGWNAGVDLRVLAKNERTNPIKQDDDLISLDVTKLAGALYAGITISIGNPRSRQWADD